MSKKIFNLIFLSLFVYFLIFYNSMRNGYYQTEKTKIKLYTEEQIKQFEEDIKNNKEVDLEKYLDYENKIETHGIKLGLNVSQAIEKYTKKGIEKAFKMLNNFIDK